MPNKYTGKKYKPKKKAIKKIKKKGKKK